MANLYKWLHELGGELNKVKVSEFEPGNNEMIATENISQGDLIAYIPDAMIMTNSEAKSNSKGFTAIKELGIEERIS